MSRDRERGGKGGKQPRKDERGGGRGPAEPKPGTFRDMITAPDRDAIGERPIVSVRPDDERDYLDEVRRREQERVELRRRGVRHGTWALLDPRGLFGPRPRRRRREALRNERWYAARPILIPDVATQSRIDVARERPQALHRLFSTPGELEPWLRGRLGAPRFEVLGPVPNSDPERDLERVGLRVDDAADLWCKTSRLSTSPADRSLRLRVSFGEEGVDDASTDEHRHRLVSEVAARILPGATAVHRSVELSSLLSEWIGGDVLYTQHIAYWNAPEGGARFHHDAFDEPEDSGQRGVVFVQLVGRTAWLALSILDLVDRVREFVEGLAQDESAWLRDDLGWQRSTFQAIQALVGNHEALLKELSLPDCGRLGVLVDRGPEFTSFLADAGHAVVLEPGDALLLPNHGYRRTAMHSVFCASSDLTYALSMGIRRL